MTPEQKKAFANEIDAVLRKYDVRFAVHQGVENWHEAWLTVA